MRSDYLIHNTSPRPPMHLCCHYHTNDFITTYDQFIVFVQSWLHNTLLGHEVRSVNEVSLTLESLVQESQRRVVEVRWQSVEMDPEHLLSQSWIRFCVEHESRWGHESQGDHKEHTNFEWGWGRDVVKERVKVGIYRHCVGFLKASRGQWVESNMKVMPGTSSSR